MSNNFFLSPHNFMDAHPDLTRAAAVYAVAIEPELQRQAAAKVEPRRMMFHYTRKSGSSMFINGAGLNPSDTFLLDWKIGQRESAENIGGWTVERVQ